MAKRWAVDPLFDGNLPLPKPVKSAILASKPPGSGECV
jgi:hypothetical protein